MHTKLRAGSPGQLPTIRFIQQRPPRNAAKKLTTASEYVSKRITSYTRITELHFQCFDGAHNNNPCPAAHVSLYCDWSLLSERDRTMQHPMISSIIILSMFTCHHNPKQQSSAKFAKPFSAVLHAPHHIFLTVPSAARDQQHTT